MSHFTSLILSHMHTKLIPCMLFHDKQSLNIVILSVVVGGAYALYRKATKISVAFVRGPVPESFVLGTSPRRFRHDMVVANST